MKILVLLLGSVVSFLILKYRRLIKEFFGDLAFAEKWLGMGGTNTLIVLFGVGVFIVSLMYALGTFQAVMEATFGRFFFTGAK